MTLVIRSSDLALRLLSVVGESLSALHSALAPRVAGLSPEAHALLTREGIALDSRSSLDPPYIVIEG